ncbi:hypothetical protein HN51_034949, partial [Arachis hypogaea]
FNTLDVSLGEQLEQVTLDSLANSIGQLTQLVQSIVQHLKNNVSSPSKVFKWVHVSFRPTASMGLDDIELAIAAYLYGDLLVDNDEEDIVFSDHTAYNDVFRSLMPGKPIVSLMLDLVADIMKIELTRESGYWFLPTVFVVFIPVSETIDEGHQYWYLVVINCVKGQIILLDLLPTEKQFKRKRTALKLAIFLDEVLEDRSFYDFETTPNLNSSQFELEEPEGLPTLEHGLNDAGVWVASWMIACFEDDHFNIKVDDGNRMKIVVSLVSKNHNMIAYRVKRKASENLRKLSSSATLVFPFFLGFEVEVGVRMLPDQRKKTSAMSLLLAMCVHFQFVVLVMNTSKRIYQCCLQCKTRYKRDKGSPQVDGDEDVDDVDDLVNELSYGQGKSPNNAISQSRVS